MKVTVKFDTANATKQISEKIGRFGGLSRRYSLLADLTDTWFGEDEYVAHFVPTKTGRLLSSGKRRGKDSYVYDTPYAGIQWDGDNGSGVPSSKWKRANNWGHDGHKKWSDWAKKYRWSKFIKNYATPRVIEEAQKMVNEK